MCINISQLTDFKAYGQISMSLCLISRTVFASTEQSAKADRQPTDLTQKAGECRPSDDKLGEEPANKDTLTASVWGPSPRDSDSEQEFSGLCYRRNLQMPSKDSVEGSAKSIPAEYSTARVTDACVQLSAALGSPSFHSIWKQPALKSSINSYEISQRELDSKTFSVKLWGLWLYNWDNEVSSGREWAQRRENHQTVSMWSLTSFFKHRVWLCSPGWPLICNPLAEVSQVLGL